MALNWAKYPEFLQSDFACKCGCGKADMDPDFMQRLQKLCKYVGPMEVTCGFRCSNHPEEREKLRGGAHSIGHAADLQYSSARQLAAILAVAESWGFKGLGIHSQFIHLDDDHPYLDRVKCVAWAY